MSKPTLPAPPSDPITEPVLPGYAVHHADDSEPIQLVRAKGATTMASLADLIVDGLRAARRSA